MNDDLNMGNMLQKLNEMMNGLCTWCICNTVMNDVMMDFIKYFCSEVF